MITVINEQGETLELTVVDGKVLVKISLSSGHMIAASFNEQHLRQALGLKVT